MLRQTVRFFGKSKNYRSNLIKYSEDRCYSSRVTSETRRKKSVLYRHLSAKILSCGPITVADYMREVLTHPTAGYYMNGDVFGKEGDFITSPEISQLFGEMIAIWILNELSKITGDSFQLVELGPGRGTLCKDFLRVFGQLKITNRLSLHLVEISPALSLVQARNLCTSSTEVEANESTHYRRGITEAGVEVFWYRSVQDVPKKFSVFVAHEFFDALPIHKFQKNNGIWNEVLVDVDANSTDEEKFRYVVTKTPTPASKIFIAPDETRDHVESSPRTMVIIEYLSSFLVENGGFALIADYGHNGEKTDTFRAFRSHKQDDPLVDPGMADLTADVDFSLIKRIAETDEKLITFGPVSQRDFLKQLEIDARLEVLLRRATEEERIAIQSGYDMIMDEDKMGNCFKFFSLFPSVLKRHLTKWPVVGFEQTSE